MKSNCSDMRILLASRDSEITACFPVIHELRPHIPGDEFLSRVRRQEVMGYRLACVWETGEVVAVAGFRIGESLAWERFIYFDDLVTLPSHRSMGYGAELLTWLKAYGAAEDCRQIHLDSGAQRKDARRFYEREGLSMAGFHFVADIMPNEGRGA